MVEIQGPDDDSPPGRSLTPPPSPEDHARLDLDGKITSLAYAFEAMRRQMDATTERTARIEGVISALMSSLDNLRGDNRDLAARTEQRVLRGLEFLDSRLAHSQGGDPTNEIAATLSDDVLKAVDSLSSQVTTSSARLEEKLSAAGARTARDLEALDSRLTRSEEFDRSARDSMSGLSERFTAAVDNLKSEFASNATRLEIQLAEESKRTESIRELIRDHSDRISGAVQNLQRLQNHLSQQSHDNETALQSVADLFHDHRITAEAAIQRVEAALNAAADREEARAQSTAATQEQQAQSLRAVEDKIEQVEREIIKRLDNTGTSTAQSTERFAKTFDQLIAAMERMDSRFSHQVSSSEYALHGTLAELERRLTEQVSEAVRSIEARVRQREETLVRLMAGGGIERPDRP